jgi:hypothetical protein
MLQDKMLLHSVPDALKFLIKRQVRFSYDGNREMQVSGGLLTFQTLHCRTARGPGKAALARGFHIDRYLLSVDSLSAEGSEENDGVHFAEG